jgi:hypothetical protein
MKIKQKLIRILGGVPRDEYEKHERARIETNKQLEELEREYGWLSERFDKVVDELPPRFKGDQVWVQEVIHGKWYVYEDDDDSIRGICSVCGNGVYFTNYGYTDERYPLCPYCGAKMDGKENEE